MSHTEQFRARLADIQSVINFKDQLQSLQWAMDEQKKALDKHTADQAAALDKWHEDESTDPKPVVPDYTATKTKIDAAHGTIDIIVAKMDETHASLDRAMKELADD